jgi:hypothetical protein
VHEIIEIIAAYPGEAALFIALVVGVASVLPTGLIAFFVMRAERRAAKRYRIGVRRARRTGMRIGVRYERARQSRGADFVIGDEDLSFGDGGSDSLRGWDGDDRFANGLLYGVYGNDLLYETDDGDPPVIAADGPRRKERRRWWQRIFGVTSGPRVEKPKAIYAALDDPDAHLNIFVDLGVPSGAPLSDVLPFVEALDARFRSYCEAKDLPFTGLAIVASEDGSWRGVLRAVRKVGAKVLEKGAEAATIAALVVMCRDTQAPPESPQPPVEQSLPPSATDVTISGGNRICNIAAPGRSAATGVRPVTMAQVEFELLVVGESQLAVIEGWAAPVPLDDQRTLPPPMMAGQRYNAAVRVVRDFQGNVILLQVDYAAPVRDRGA